MKISALGEFALIEKFKGYAPVDKTVIAGIGDDAAVVPYSAYEYLLLTTDMLAQNRHFTLKMPALGIGHKALACSISDIAAMGGVPQHALVSIGVPKNLRVRFIEELYQGIRQIALDFHVSLVGGDTIETDSLIINVALTGRVKKEYLTRRAGAKPKDWIFVTGPLGGSFKSGRHLNFTPRVAQAQFLVKKFKPSAMMDISDGLSGDLNHILKASGVGAVLDTRAIPRHSGVSLEQAVHEGEDFELLFTLDPSKAIKLMAWQARQGAFYFYPIGTITADEHQRIDAHSFTHFS